MTLRRDIILAATLLTVGLPSLASATLGGDISSITADRISVQGSLTRMVRSDAYTLHEIRSASGVMIREYVSSSGTVFAVAWQGPWLPDLRVLLGPYHARFEQEAQLARQKRQGHGPLSVQTADFVVQTSGHQRSFAGRVYLPQLLPLGVSLQSIQ